jgi:hypothetical protein
MKKRIFLVLLVLTLAAGGAFAQASIGIGGSFSADWDSITTSGSGVTSEYLMTTSGVDVFAFLDIGFVEVDVGLLFGSQKVKATVLGISGEVDGPNVTILTLGLFGKFPINMSGFTLFPMIGIQYDIGLSAKQTIGGVTREAESKDLPDAYNRLWVKAGVGADFNLTDSIFLRPSFLLGLNFGTKNLADTVKLATETPGTVAFLYSGLDIRVALGLRL